MLNMSSPFHLVNQKCQIPLPVFSCWSCCSEYSLLLWHFLINDRKVIQSVENMLQLSLLGDQPNLDWLLKQKQSVCYTSRLVCCFIVFQFGLCSVCLSSNTLVILTLSRQWQLGLIYVWTQTSFAQCEQTHWDWETFSSQTVGWRNTISEKT